MTPHDLALWYEAKDAEQRIVADLAPVDAADVFVISGFVANISRNRKRLDNVFSVNGLIYADVAEVGLEAFEPNQVKTYRLDRVERNVNGEDVEVIEMPEVEWRGGKLGYVETGDAL